MLLSSTSKSTFFRSSRDVITSEHVTPHHMTHQNTSHDITSSSLITCCNISPSQISRSPKLRMAYFTQHHVDQLDMNMTCIEHFQKLFGDAQEQDIRGHLAKYGLSGKLPLARIDTLSGGQKSKLVFGQIAWKQPHIMLLDEPSNHLDLETIESLAEALNAFEGGIVMISHNQMLIEMVCKEMWVCHKDGFVEVFDGMFEEYKKGVLKELGLY